MAEALLACHLRKCIARRWSIWLDAGRNIETESAVPARVRLGREGLMAQSTRQPTTKNIRAMMNRLETTARRVEKEFERQMKALDRARMSVRREVKKQMQDLRREQRGFLTRIRKASSAPTRSSPGTG